MKIRDKNPVLKNIIEELEKAGREKKAPVWERLAEMLNKPSRKRVEVRIYDIEKNAVTGETVVVPGTVLSDGEMKKPVRIAALRFTETARTKIEKSGGKCISIEELMKEHATGKGAKIRILG